MTERIRFRASNTDVKQIFDFAHCRIFETLHRLYFLSYTGAQDRFNIQKTVVTAICESDPSWRFHSNGESADCDRVNGTVGATRPLLQIAQMVGWYTFGHCGAEMEFFAAAAMTSSTIADDVRRPRSR